MEFRWISGSELDRLDPIIEEQGWTPLDRTFSKALIAEDEEGNLIGFNVVQAIVRPEPLWVNKKNRGKEQDIAMKLATKMANHLNEVGCPYWEIRAKSPFVERLCVANNMEPIDCQMYAGGAK